MTADAGIGSDLRMRLWFVLWNTVRWTPFGQVFQQHSIHIFEGIDLDPMRGFQILDPQVGYVFGIGLSKVVAEVGVMSVSRE